MIDPYLNRLVAEAAQAAAGRVRQVNLEGLWQRFIAAATSPVFAERLPLARSQRWAGAVPTWEHPGATFTTNADPLPAIGIDGSQVYPIDRNPVLWAYVQAVAYRRGAAPVLKSRFVDIGAQMASQGDLVEELEESRDQLNGLTNSWRTILEMQSAREAALQNPDHLVMIDNGLLPWVSVSGQVAMSTIQEYLMVFQSTNPCPIAGVISGPQSRLLERVVHLVEGVTDRREFLDQSLMMHVLKPGERSALFLHGSTRNDRFQRVGAGIYFFFLRTAQHELARVEVPVWVARDVGLLERVHAAVLADACVGGYSYVLSQAHQHVMISGDVARALHQTALTWFTNSVDQVTRQSGKASMKYEILYEKGTHFS